MLNPPLAQDVTFHQAVNLGRYNQEKVVSFVPPDGEFELMKYRCQDGISSPFTVLPVITEHGRTRVEVMPALTQLLDTCLVMYYSCSIPHRFRYSLYVAAIKVVPKTRVIV